jgi:hypothetical protein
MKAKKHTRHSHRNRHRDEILPHELGTHLFAIIRRNLGRKPQLPPEQHVQLSFGFQVG